MSQTNKKPTQLFCLHRFKFSDKCRICNFSLSHSNDRLQELKREHKINENKVDL